MVGALVARPQPLSAPLAQRLLRSKRAVTLAPARPRPEDAHRVLDPFLRQGATGAVLPLATPGEVLGTLTVVSFDPARPLERPEDRRRRGRGRPGGARDRQRPPLPAAAGLLRDHAALAPPAADPQRPGPRRRARVPVVGTRRRRRRPLRLRRPRRPPAGGRDRRRARKGISAAADMAMAKYIFRVLARGEADPAAFLRAANDVACDEIEHGKFVTLLYGLVDVAGREVAIASAGHPPARVVSPGGRVVALGRHRPSARDRARPGVRAGASGARAGLARSSSTRTASSRPAAAASSTAKNGSTGSSPRRRPSRPGAGSRDPVPTAVRSPAASSETTAPSSVSSWHAESRMTASDAAAPSVPARVRRPDAPRHRRFHGRGGHARHRDRRLAAARALLRELDDRLGEHHRADPALSLHRLLARRQGGRPAAGAAAARLDDPRRRRCRRR